MNSQNPPGINIQKSSMIPFDLNLLEFLNSLFYYFPSLKTIILDRLPDECSENYLMTYQTLFTQYNIMVLIGLFVLFICVCLYTTIYVLNFIKIHKLYFIERSGTNNFLSFLGKLANSSFIDYSILFLNLSLYLNFIVLGQCLYFMYVNYIPSNIGNITDIALQSNNI